MSDLTPPDPIDTATNRYQMLKLTVDFGGVLDAEEAVEMAKRFMQYVAEGK